MGMKKKYLGKRMMDWTGSDRHRAFPTIWFFFWLFVRVFDPLRYCTVRSYGRSNSRILQALIGMDGRCHAV